MDSDSQGQLVAWVRGVSDAEFLVVYTAADEPVAGAAGGGGLKALEAEDEVAMAGRSGTDGRGRLTVPWTRVAKTVRARAQGVGAQTPTPGGKRLDPRGPIPARP